MQLNPHTSACTPLTAKFLGLPGLVHSTPDGRGMIMLVDGSVEG